MLVPLKSQAKVEIFGAGLECRYQPYFHWVMIDMEGGHGEIERAARRR